MGKRIKIKAGSVEQTAELYDTECAEKIWDALPITASASTWGDEIYFHIPVACGPENPQETVEMGDLGYWLAGSCFCIFFGPTPASRGDEIRPASEVNVFGKLEGRPTDFRQVPSGTEVVIERIE